MKRRTAALAAIALTLVTVSGAVAEAVHYWNRPEADCGMPGVDRNKDWWYFHGQFRGTATVLMPGGAKVGEIRVEGSSADEAVRMIYSHEKKDLARASLRGMGKHPIYGENKTLLGYVVLSPFTTQQEKEIVQEDQEVEEDYDDFYRRPERVTPSDDKRGFSNIVELPGLVGGYLDDDFKMGEETRGLQYGAAFKVYGEAKVTVRYAAAARNVTIPDNHGETQTRHFPAKTLTASASSEPVPADESLEKMTTEEREYYRKLQIARRPVPDIYWSLAAEAKDYSGEVTARGDWKRPLRSGHLTGYGKHEVRDASGKNVLLTIDVAPLPKSALTPPRKAR